MVTCPLAFCHRSIEVLDVLELFDPIEQPFVQLDRQHHGGLFAFVADDVTYLRHSGVRNKDATAEAPAVGVGESSAKVAQQPRLIGVQAKKLHAATGRPWRARGHCIPATLLNRSEEGTLFMGRSSLVGEFRSKPRRSGCAILPAFFS